LKTTYLRIIVAGATLGLGACALQPPYADPLARANATLSAARDAHGRQASPEEYRLASAKLALSERFISVRDDKPARWLAEQAEVDAELARMKAMSARAIAEAARQAEVLRLKLRVTEGAAR
jgi:hypothetical protein